MFGKAFNKNYLKYIMMILVVFNLYPSGNKLDVETDEATIDFNNEEKLQHEVDEILRNDKEEIKAMLKEAKNSYKPQK